MGFETGQRHACFSLWRSYTGYFHLERGIHLTGKVAADHQLLGKFNGLDLFLWLWEVEMHQPQQVSQQHKTYCDAALTDWGIIATGAVIGLSVLGRLLCDFSWSVSYDFTRVGVRKTHILNLSNQSRPVWKMRTEDRMCPWLPQQLFICSCLGESSMRV